MTSPAEIRDLLNMVKTAIKKIAIIVVANDDRRYVVTQNREIISLFHPTRGYKDFEQNVDPDSNLFECYELRFDKVITLDASNIKCVEFIGIPEEISPPMYLNPKFEGMVAPETLVELQKPSLLEIKETRDKGYIVDEPYDSEKIYKLHTVKAYIENTLKLSFNDHPAFKIFQNPLLNDFHLYSNKIESDKVLELAERLYFMPAILTCYNHNIENLSKQEIINFIDNENIIGELKDKWIQRLDKYRTDYLETIKKEMSEANNFLNQELNDKLSFKSLQLLIARSLNTNIEAKESTKEYNEKLEDLIAAIKDKCNDEFDFTDEVKEKIDNLISVFVSTVAQPDVPVAGVITQEAIKQYIKTAVNNVLQIKEQYNLIIEQTKKLNFADDLKYINDYRLYLRYWPAIFQTNEVFHHLLRPLTTLELQVLNALLYEGIEIEYKRLFPGFINEMQAYNSILNELQDQTEIMREKRLAQIQTVAQERVDEIKNEMSQLYDTMGEEEKKLFNDMIVDISDIEKYKQELNNEPRLLDVLMYWPLSLYPKPENVVQS